MNMKNILTTFSNTRVPSEKINWQEVYDVYLPRVYHFFCYKLGNIDIAEDLTAITFEKAWISRKNFHEEIGHVSTWLMGIARNVAVDYFRKKNREVSLEDFRLQNLSTNEVEIIQQKMDFQYILQILSRYPDRECELIALKYGSELSNREIARLTGLSESNVGTILNRVVEKLRKEWETYHEG